MFLSADRYLLPLLLGGGSPTLDTGLGVRLTEYSLLSGLLPENFFFFPLISGYLCIEKKFFFYPKATFGFNFFFLFHTWMEEKSRKEFHTFAILKPCDVIVFQLESAFLIDTMAVLSLYRSH